MPIVTHTHEQSVQPNGSTHNVLRMYDQDGREYMQTFWAPAGLDIDGKIAQAKADMDEQLKAWEFEALVGVG